MTRLLLVAVFAGGLVLALTAILALASLECPPPPPAPSCGVWVSA